MAALVEELGNSLGYEVADDLQLCLLAVHSTPARDERFLLDLPAPDQGGEKI